jgi:hypothetical protein
MVLKANLFLPQHGRKRLALSWNISQKTRGNARVLFSAWNEETLGLGKRNRWSEQ